MPSGCRHRPPEAGMRNQRRPPRTRPRLPGQLDAPPAVRHRASLRRTGLHARRQRRPAREILAARVEDPQAAGACSVACDRRDAAHRHRAASSATRTTSPPDCGLAAGDASGHWARSPRRPAPVRPTSATRSAGVSCTQVFRITQCIALLEGQQRGPAEHRATLGGDGRRRARLQHECRGLESRAKRHAPTARRDPPSAAGLSRLLDAGARARCSQAAANSSSVAQATPTSATLRARPLVSAEN